MRNNLNKKKKKKSVLFPRWTSCSYSFKSTLKYSSRINYSVPSVEASLKITWCNWRRSMFSIRSVLTLITVLNGFGKHYPSRYALYSNTGLVYASITWNYTRAQECSMHSGFPTHENAFRYLHSEILLENFNNSFKRLVEIFWFSIHFNLPSDYNWPQSTW